MNRTHLVSRILLYTILIFSSQVSFTQENTSIFGTENTPLTAQETPTLESISTKIEQLEANQELDEAKKAKLLEIYKNAQSQLESAQQLKVSAENYGDYIQAAPQQIKIFEERLQQLQKQSTEETNLFDIPAGTSSKELEAPLNEQLSALASFKTALYEIQQKIKDPQKQPAKIRELIDEAQKSIEEINTDLATGAPAVDSPLETEAYRTAQLAKRETNQAKIEMLNQELLSYDIRSKQLAIEEEVKKREIELAADRAKSFKERVDRLRLQEAEQTRKEAELAKSEALGKHPVIIELAEANAKLSNTNTLVAQRIKEVEPQIEEVRKQIEEVKRDYENAQRQIAIVGLSEALAEILLNQRRSLKRIKRKENAIEKRKNEIGSVGLDRFHTEEELQSLSDLKLTTEAIFKDRVDPDLKAKEKDEIKSEIADLLQKKHQVLISLKENYGALLRQLGELAYEENRSVEKIGEYANFLDERLVWIPSAAPFALKDLSRIIEATQWLINVDNWKATLKTLAYIPLRTPLANSITFFIILFLLFTRKRFLKKIKSYPEKLQDVSTDRLTFTFSALGITILLASPIALILAFLGWQMMEISTASDFVKGTGYGLLCVAATLFGFRFLQNLCWKNGLAEAHFQFKRTTTRYLRTHLRWFMPPALATTFVVALLEWQPNNDFQDSLGRLAFVIGMIAFTIFVHCLVRPKNGVLTARINAHPNSWLSRLRNVWYSLAVGLPLILAIMGIYGYYYTALQLELRTMATLWLLLGTIILYHLSMRWLILKKKKLALEQQQRAERATRENAQQESKKTDFPATEVPEINLASLNQQSVKLLRSSFFFLAILGIWFIWASVLPALNLLNSVELWQQITVQDGETVSQPITLARLLFGLLIVVITIVAAKNIPGILEIAILRNLPLLPGTRYAWVILCQYVLVLIGMIAAFNTIGINWSKLGWIVAALSVGLGFGLQEVVANFVCGILLLAERPIRVGDIVTVSDTTGVVSKIRIRATTIVNWDRKELLVPNKEFITGRILNWTLSNQVTRIVISVGIAYGSDTEKARSILLKVAQDHPEVLSDPAPLATFDNFGDSSLDLTLRCYLPNLEKRLITVHELHTIIHKRFAEEGIEIPFPQRDLHLRTVESVIDVKTSDGEPSKKILETRVSSDDKT